MGSAPIRPGWSNNLYMAAVLRDGVLGIEYIQPEEQSNAMVVLYRASAAVSGSMRDAVAVAKGWRCG